MRRALPPKAERSSAIRLLLLAAGLLALAWHLTPGADSSRPLVATLFVLSLCGGWCSAVAGTARLLGPQPGATP